MFNTLAGRALVPVGIAVTGFMVVCCLLLYSVIKSGIKKDAVFHATNLADTILKSTRYAMLKSDRETLSTIIRNIGEQRGVEHVRIFDKKGIVNISAKSGEINQQVDKNTEGCISCHAGPVPLTTLGTMQQARTFKTSNGKEIMAITAPIYNEPECFNAACHFHSPGQKVLGTLDIGLSQESLVKSLVIIRAQMILFTLMTLALTVGGVTAMLRRSVFLPIQRLKNYIKHTETGGGAAVSPPHLPHDLNGIATSYHNLVQKLERAEGKLRTSESTTGQPD